MAPPGLGPVGGGGLPPDFGPTPPAGGEGGAEPVEGPEEVGGPPTALP